jgi:hypothetical protein
MADSAWRDGSGLLCFGNSHYLARNKFVNNSARLVQSIHFRLWYQEEETQVQGTMQEIFQGKLFNANNEVNLSIPMHSLHTTPMHSSGHDAGFDPDISFGNL